MAEAELPEEIIVRILSFLPVKSLIRFTCLSKRFHFIILSDPKFAKTQFQAAWEHKIPNRRLLYATPSLLESLDLETPSFGEPSSVRKLEFPFKPPAHDVSLLGSCNGIVFVAFAFGGMFYIWNPSTRFFKKLPDHGFSARDEAYLIVYGVGYLPATDDYRVFIVSTDEDDYEATIFSSRAHSWKAVDVKDEFHSIHLEGTYVNEALHWINGDEIVAFDLAQEQLRTMQLPRDFHDIEGGRRHYDVGVSAGGCLTLFRIPLDVSDCVDVWIMREYDVPDSWTKLFNMKVPNLPVGPNVVYCGVIVLETSMIAQICIGLENVFVQILQKEEDKRGMYNVGELMLGMVHLTQYQESLLQIDG